VNSKKQPIVSVGWASLAHHAIPNYTLGSDQFSYCYTSDGSVCHGGGISTLNSPYTVGDTIGCMIDFGQSTKGMAYGMRSQ
jgi:hypothetical protein